MALVPAQALLRLKEDPIFAMSVLMPGMVLPPHQVDMLRGMWEATYSYNSCGRSTGKTALTGIFALLWAATHPATQLLTLGLKFKTGQLMFDFMDRQLKKFPELAKCVKLTSNKAFMKRDSSEWRIDFKNGSRIATIPSDLNRKGERVRGYRCNVEIIDEIAAIPQDIVRQVFIPCCSITDSEGKRKIIKLTTGGYKPSAAWDDVRQHYLEYSKGNKEYYFSNYCYLDVPNEFSYIIDAEAIKNMESNSSPEEAAREIYGRWTAVGGNYYNPMMLERNRALAIDFEYFPEDVGTRDSIYVMGFDPAMAGSDETALTVLKKVGERKWVVVASVAFNFRTGWAQRNAELLLDYINRFNPAFIGMDRNGGEQAMHEMRQYFADNPAACPIATDAEVGTEGNPIIRIFTPTSTGRDNNTRLNTRLLSALDGNGNPSLFLPGAEEDAMDMLGQLDKLVVQMVNIQATDIESQPGFKKFSSTMKKDRYSSLLYAYNAAEELVDGDDYSGAAGGASYIDDCAVIYSHGRFNLR